MVITCPDMVTNQERIADFGQERRFLLGRIKTDMSSRQRRESISHISELRKNWLKLQFGKHVMPFFLLCEFKDKLICNSFSSFHSPIWKPIFAHLLLGSFHPTIYLF